MLQYISSIAGVLFTELGQSRFLENYLIYRLNARVGGTSTKEKTAGTASCRYWGNGYRPNTGMQGRFSDTQSTSAGRESPIVPLSLVSEPQHLDEAACATPLPLSASHYTPEHIDSTQWCSWRRAGACSGVDSELAITSHTPFAARNYQVSPVPVERHT
jgi:hypothetical protein